MLGVNSVMTIVIQYPTAGLFAAFLFAFIEALPIIGSLVPGIALMGLVGYWIGANIISFSETLLVCFLGAFIGDYLSFIFGKKYSDTVKNWNYFKNKQKLIIKGQQFLDRYGAFAIIIGRFIGPIRSSVPIIAGLLNMKERLFIIGAIPSALIWTLIYLSPGIIYASFAMYAPKAFTFRLIRYLILVCFLSFYYRYQIEISNYLSNKINQSSELINLYLSFLISWGMFFWIILSVVHQTMFYRLNEPFYFLFQSTQTKLADNFMLGFTYIGEIYFVGTFVLIWSIYALRSKKYHLIQYLYLNLFITVILTYLVKMAIEIPRPIIGESITTSFSFPSGHTSIVASMAATIQWATSNSKVSPSRLLHYILFIVVGMTAFSRAYLGMHWVTDVFGAILLVHPIVTFCNYFIKNKKVIELMELNIILFITLVITGLLITFFPSHKHYLISYQMNTPRIDIHYDNWQKNQLTTLRFNRTHLSAEPLNIQFVGSKEKLDQLMIENGWKVAPSYTLSTALGLLDSPKYNYISPLLKQLYLNKEPIAAYYKSTNEELFIAKFWESEYYTVKGNIILGTTTKIHDPNAPSPWLEPLQKSFSITPLLSLPGKSYTVANEHNKHTSRLKWDQEIFKIEVLDE